MSLTVEALAQLQEFVPYAQKHSAARKGYVVGMRRKNKRDELDERDVYLSKPQVIEFIERHSAAGQQEPARDVSYPVGFQLDSARTDAFLGGPQPPKPAGAVPLPEPVAKRSTTHGGEILCEPVYSAEQLMAYGDAREAAGRAVAVSTQIVGWVHEDQLPEGYPYDAMFPHSKVDGVRMFPVLAPIPQQPEAEGDDIAVDRFAEAMKAKMAAARAKGRGGWEGPTCNAQMLSDMLRNHVEKGDPRDVANFCMMLWNRGESIQAAEGAGREAVGVVDGPDRGGSISQTATLLRPLSSGTKLYASPTPAADAGGVTVDRVLMPRTLNADMSLEAQAQVAGVDDEMLSEIWEAFVRSGALTPEVRHG